MFLKDKKLEDSLEAISELSVTNGLNLVHVDPR